MFKPEIFITDISDLLISKCLLEDSIGSILKQYLFQVSN